MTDQPRTDELAQLRAEVTALRARIERPRRRFPRRFRPLAVVALLVALLPFSILAAGPVFSDLGTAAEVHRPNIQAIGDAGITTGFEDPANPGQRLYNPKDNVTREEMASFLARTAGLGGNAPVANAKTATNATQLGGLPATSYVRTEQIAVKHGISAFYGRVGPLPFVSDSFNSPGGAALLFITASGYRTPVNGPGDIKVDVKVDDAFVGGISVYTNETNSHKPLVKVIATDLSAGAHTISLTTGTGTTTNGNDIFDITVLMLP